MVFVVTNKADGFQRYCRKNSLNPRDQRQVICVSSLERAHGLRPGKDDEIIALEDASSEVLQLMVRTRKEAIETASTT